MTKNMQSLFRGFVPTKNKKCLMPFKGKSSHQLMTYDQVKDLDEFAGILEDDTILIDIDDLEQSEMFMNIVEEKQLNCPVIRTSRGRHGLFKNSGVEKCYTHTKLACGLTADIKVGHKNSYQVLKFEGKERFIEWDIEEGQEYQEIPKWLHPIKSSMEFVNMEAGEGRNQALFNYILTLQSNGFSVEEARETIRIINRFVLKEPLSDDELEIIIRDDSFAKPVFFKGSKFLHDRFAAYLKSNYHIIRNDGAILIYKDGVYEYSKRDIEKAMSVEIPSLKNSQRKEVLSQLDLMCDEVPSSPTNLIAFRNGVLNIETGELLPFSPDYVITNKIHWDYNPHAYFELADYTLNRIACDDPEIRLILEEVIGACFYRSNTLAGGKAFILTGEGSNGKSTFISVLNRILGKDNTCSLDLKNLADRFSTVMMYKKLANLGDDISDEFNSDLSVFKKIATGQEIEAEQKGQEKFNFEPYCKLIFSANNVPRTRDKTGSVQRRLIIVPFNAKFSADDHDFDPQITWKLQTQESIEYFIALGIKGLQRVLENRKFTTSAKVEKELEDYAERNNPVLAFIKHCDEEEISILNEPVREVFLRYSTFCSENGYVALANNEFSKQVQRIMKIKTDRRRVRGSKNKVSIFTE